jgi:hypothetical protein
MEHNTSPHGPPFASGEESVQLSSNLFTQGHASTGADPEFELIGYHVEELIDLLFAGVGQVGQDLLRGLFCQRCKLLIVLLNVPGLLQKKKKKLLSKQ